MISFILMVLLGVCQFFVLKRLLLAVLKGDFKNTAIMLVLKFALYGGVLSFVLLVLKDNPLYAGAGFCAGLPGAVITYAVFSLIKNKKSHKKGDDNS